MAKKRTTKKPADHQQIARKVLDALVPDAEPTKPAKAEPEKNPAAVALGRLGGLKGGNARAEKLTTKKRSEAAKKGAQSSWKKKNSLASVASLSAMCWMGFRQFPVPPHPSQN